MKSPKDAPKRDSFGIAAWVIADNYTGGDSATEDATALIGDFNAAGSANVGATAKTMTEDVVLWSNGDVISGADAWAKEIETAPGLTVERLAPVSVEGDYATTFARFAVREWGSTAPSSGSSSSGTASSRGSGSSRPA